MSTAFHNCSIAHKLRLSPCPHPSILPSSKMSRQKPELLAPAGNFEKLTVALHYGADAVYLGLSNFSLRAKAKNFSPESLRDAVEFVHALGKKIFVTVNIFLHNSDIPPLEEHINALREIRPDGIIVADPGVFDMVAGGAPEIPVHISTQANITSFRAAQFWERMGAKRLILGREVSIDDIKEIRQKVALELECFVHGALCIAYSGRCYISSHMTNRSANSGNCTNSCRWNYALMEEKRPGQYFPVYEDERGTSIMDAQDLCMIEYLDRLADAGIDSFKIEGRMKGINYLAGVIKVYREAIDSLSAKQFRVKENWRKELAAVSNRGYSTGLFFENKLGPDREIKDMNQQIAADGSHEKRLLGVVSALVNGHAEVTLRSSINNGDKIIFLSPGLENDVFLVEWLKNTMGSHISVGKNGERIIMLAPQGIRVNDLVRHI